jgi:hypothetical protein
MSPPLQCSITPQRRFIAHVVPNSKAGLGVIRPDALPKFKDNRSIRSVWREFARLINVSNFPTTKFPTAKVDVTNSCATALYQKFPDDRGPGISLVATHNQMLDLAQSSTIGDTVGDMVAGRNAGCRTVLVRTGYAGHFGHAHDCIDHSVANITQAAQIKLGAPSRKENP